MRNFILFSIVVMALGGRLLYADSLNDWILAQVRKDEQLLADAVLQTGGHSLELLKDSRIYMPFFLEAPESHASALMEYKPLFDAWENDNSQKFLSGGYIYRLSFANAPPLYATSAGHWDGIDWHSLDLGKDLAVEPSRVWNGSGDDYLFATSLYGVPPKIVVYDQQGEVKREEAFDANAADLEQRVAAAEQTYVGKGSPILEMLSLAEYVENPDASWRKVDLSGQFNLRNQQQRDAERERLKSAPHLTRNTAIEALQSKSSPQEPQRPRASLEPMPAAQAPEPMKSPKAGPTPVEEPSSSTRWLLVAVLVVAALGLLGVWLKKRK